LAFIEEANLRDLGRGLAIASPEFQAASTKLHQTPLPMFICPSRRTARIYPSTLGQGTPIREQPWLADVAREGVVKGDYAANSGDAAAYSGLPFYRPESYAAIKPELWTPTNVCLSPGSPPEKFSEFCQTGIMYYRSELKESRITDGTSKTYLVGEKWMQTNGYEGASELDDPGNTASENQSIYAGYVFDNHRVAWNPNGSASQESCQPARDFRGTGIWFEDRQFGSAHPSAFQMAFCDGSVHSIPYEIDPGVHRALANRSDGEIVSGDAF
jgi:hypothetical protein